jgi:hypothetical protein
MKLDLIKGSSKTAFYAGSGLATGAAIGMIFGLMLFENLAHVACSPADSAPHDCSRL